MKQIHEDVKHKVNPVWNKDQDDYLVDVITTHGDTEWHIIADYMGRKYKSTKFSDKDCHDRWQLFLSMNGKKPLWSNRERYLLLIAHKQHKNRWSEIARMLHKTSRNLIKNRFYTLFRKIRNRVKNNDIYINSPLDLLEIYYVLQLVEEYFNMPATNIAEEKNYAHKLVQRMDKQKVTDYFNRVTALYSNKGTINDLFKECGQLYAEDLGSIAVESEAMECNQIAIDENEEEAKITLPFPKDFNKERMISNEEKNDFWMCAFHNKEAKSAQVPYSADNSANSSFFSQVQSAGSMAMREDEGFGFSQFINPYEGGDKKLYSQLHYPSAGSPDNHFLHVSSPFRNNSGMQKPGDYTVATALQSVHSPSAFAPFNGVQEGFQTQQPIHVLPQL